jgi:hypothetical protein
MAGHNVQHWCPTVSKRTLRGTGEQRRTDAVPRQATIGIQDTDAAQLSDRHTVRGRPHLPEFVVRD